MSLMKPSTGGTWWLKSKSDPRWDCEGSSFSCGGLVMPPECRKMVDKLKTLLGKQPSDLEFGYTKH